jgi:hypothetical protein
MEGRSRVAERPEGKGGGAQQGTAVDDEGGKEEGRRGGGRKVEVTAIRASVSEYEKEGRRYKPILVTAIRASVSEYNRNRFLFFLYATQ